MTSRRVDAYTRRVLLERAGRAALAAGAPPLARPPVEPAFAAPGGVFGSLARSIPGAGALPRDPPPAPPGGPRAPASRLLFNTRFDAVHPRAIVFCETTGDVERTVRWARRHGVHIVPRSGGHSYGGESVTAGGGVAVARLARVDLGAAHRATIGTGARMIDVYSTLWAHRRTIPAGSCPTVGIAGLA